MTSRLGFKSSLPLVVLLISTFLSAAPQIDINQYIKSDFLSEEIQLKESFQKKKLDSLYIQKKQEFKYPSYDDFWRFTFEYWMVKNVRYLKWDQAVENAEITKEFDDLLNIVGIKLNKIRIYILPTSWIPHFAMPLGKSSFSFFISQQFIKESSLNASQAALVLLNEYIKLRNGYLMNFLQDNEFVKKLGKDFFLNKRPDISQFEKLVEKISYFFRFYGVEFKDAFKNYKELESLLKEKDVSTYKRFQETYRLIYNARQSLSEKFPRILGTSPSVHLYYSWFLQ